MATSAWDVNGQYYETCNCDFVCGCVAGQLANRPTKGSCQFAMAFQIDRGKYAAVTLDGLGFIVLGMTPEEMGKGNWSVGLVIDARHAELQLANTGHPAADTFTLAHASRSHVNALGLRWDDVTGKNNGQYAPFSWKGE